MTGLVWVLHREKFGPTGTFWCVQNVRPHRTLWFDPTGHSGSTPPDTDISDKSTRAMTYTTLTKASYDSKIRQGQLSPTGLVRIRFHQGKGVSLHGC